MKHTKQERKEKLFYKLEQEYFNAVVARREYRSSTKLRDYLYHNFYDWFRMSSAPNWYRRMLNKRRRASHKNIIRLVRDNSLDWDNAVFDDNYRDSGRYW